MAFLNLGKALFQLGDDPHVCFELGGSLEILDEYFGLFHSAENDVSDDSRSGGERWERGIFLNFEDFEAGPLEQGGDDFFSGETEVIRECQRFEDSFRG